MTDRKGDRKGNRVLSLRSVSLHLEERHSLEHRRIVDLDLVSIGPEAPGDKISGGETGGDPRLQTAKGTAYFFVFTSDSSTQRASRLSRRLPGI